MSPPTIFLQKHDFDHFDIILFKRLSCEISFPDYVYLLLDRITHIYIYIYILYNTTTYKFSYKRLVKVTFLIVFYATNVETVDAYIYLSNTAVYCTVADARNSVDRTKREGENKITSGRRVVYSRYV